MEKKLHWKCLLLDVQDHRTSTKISLVTHLSNNQYCWKQYNSVFLLSYYPACQWLDCFPYFCYFQLFVFGLKNLLESFSSMFELIYNLPVLLEKKNVFIDFFEKLIKWWRGVSLTSFKASSSCFFKPSSFCCAFSNLGNQKDVNKRN